MRLLVRQLALLACVALTGSIADASPAKRGRHAKVKKKQARQRKPAHKSVVKKTKHVREDEDADSDTDTVAFATHDVDAEESIEDEAEVDEVDEVDEAPVVVHEGGRKRAKEWHVAVGPYLWASAVQANVSLGSANVSAGVDFFSIEKHAKYGVPLLAEVRYRRFSLVTDFMYGVIGVNGAKEVGPVMVTVDGTAASLTLDSIGGYRVFGGEQSPLAIEACAGLRYQRTVIAGSLALGSGNPITPPESINGGADGVAGARVFVRPSRWLSVVGNVDMGVVGSSTRTWSAAVDASLRIRSRVMVSLGWRTMTMDRAYVEMVMRGPRAAVQVLF